MYCLEISNCSQYSKVEQIVNGMSRDIEAGLLPRGAKLPSINKFSEQHKVGRETIEKAYRSLRKRGYISSYRGRGYFVLDKKDKEHKALLVLNKLSSFKKIIFDSMVEALAGKVKVDLQVHHYDSNLLREIVETSRGKYHHYLIMPHFFADTDPKEYIDTVKMIPAHELILLDKNIPQLKFPHKAVYQDFKTDIYNALRKSERLLKKYHSITVVIPEHIHHVKEIAEGVSCFCSKKGFGFKLTNSVRGKELEKGVIYIVTDEDDLAELIKKARETNLEMGKDIGIISFNETIYKELLDITVVTTDFHEMGRTAAKLILSEECEQYKNPFHIIRRKSL